MSEVIDKVRVLSSYNTVTRKTEYLAHGPADVPNYYWTSSLHRALLERTTIPIGAHSSFFTRRQHLLERNIRFSIVTIEVSVVQMEDVETPKFSRMNLIQQQKDKERNK